MENNIVDAVVSNKDVLLKACWDTLGKIVTDGADIKCVEFLISGRPLIKKNGKNFGKGYCYGNKRYEAGKEDALREMEMQKNQLTWKGVKFPLPGHYISQLMYGYADKKMGDVSNLCEAYHDFAQNLGIIANDTNIATTLPCIRVKSDSFWTRLRIFYGASINKLMEGNSLCANVQKKRQSKLK